MATARRLSPLLVVAVLVAGMCFAAVAQGVVLGHTTRATKLQDLPGSMATSSIPLAVDTYFTVRCRKEGSVVAQDPWWLKVDLAIGSTTGYVADADAVCDGDTPGGNCDTVPHCIG